MKCFCGTDIIEVDRVKNAIEKTKGFKEEVFTEIEISFADIKGEKIRFQHYAGRFAAKEAIYKAVSNIYSELEFKDIEIVNDRENKQRPVAKILKKADVLKGIKIDVSISHVKEYAVANAVVSIDN